MRRRELRLRGFDYSTERLYFVTMCTRGRGLLFGEVIESEVRLSPVGALANGCLLDTPGHHPDVEIDSHVVMPNHVHAVLASKRTPLGVIVGTFKAAVSRTTETRVWQRGYHDHVVRNEDDLERIRDYIATNPIRWALDPENPRRRS